MAKDLKRGDFTLEKLPQKNYCVNNQVLYLKKINSQKKGKNSKNSNQYYGIILDIFKSLSDGFSKTLQDIYYDVGHNKKTLKKFLKLVIFLQKLSRVKKMAGDYYLLYYDDKINYNDLFKEFGKKGEILASIFNTLDTRPRPLSHLSRSARRRSKTVLIYLELIIFIQNSPLINIKDQKYQIITNGEVQIQKIEKINAKT